jgi:hypothetical protein
LGRGAALASVSPGSLACFLLLTPPVREPGPPLLLAAPPAARCAHSAPLLPPVTASPPPRPVVTFVYFTYSCAGSLALEEHSLKRRGVSYTGKSPDPGIVRIVSQAPDTGDLVYMPPSSAGLGDAKALEGTKATDAAV